MVMVDGGVVIYRFRYVQVANYAFVPHCASSRLAGWLAGWWLSSVINQFASEFRVA
jgi:hypothetical protein